MRPATPRQKELLRFVRGYQQARGYSPSFSEIATGIGAGSKSVVFRILRELETRGLVRCLPCRERAIELLTDVSIPRAPDGAPLFVVPGIGGE